MSDTFAFLRLTARQGDWQYLHSSLTNHLAPSTIWGAFYGLFGVGSNELIAVTVGDYDRDECKNLDPAGCVQAERALTGAAREPVWVPCFRA